MSRTGRDRCQVLYYENLLSYEVHTAPLQRALRSEVRRRCAATWALWMAYLHLHRRAEDRRRWLSARPLVALRRALWNWRRGVHTQRRYRIFADALAVVVWRGIVRPRFNRYARIVRKLRRREQAAAAAAWHRRKTLHVCVRTWVRHTFHVAFLRQVLDRLFGKVGPVWRRVCVWRRHRGCCRTRPRPPVCVSCMILQF